MTGRRPRTVLAAAVLTYLGAGALLVSGSMFLFGAGGGSFLGSPTEVVVLMGARLPISAAPTAGAGQIVLAVVLIGLTVWAQRGHPAGRRGLTVLGAIVILALLLVVFTTDPVSPLVPILWIAVAVALLWIRRPDDRRLDRGRGSPTA